ncbi:MAG: TlpA family protein disulfide reductase [Bacillota bacterium]
MDKRFKSGLIAVLVILIIGLGFYYYQLDETTPQEKQQELSEQLEEGISLNQIAPDFTLTNLAGEEVSLSDYRGDYVILNFWATWCPPCRREMPNLEEFYATNKDDFVVLAVDLGEAKQQVQQFIEEGGYSFPVLLDHDKEIGTKYNVSAIPTSYFIDPQGVIKHIKKGAVTTEELNQIKKDIKN